MAGVYDTVIEERVPVSTAMRNHSVMAPATSHRHRVAIGDQLTVSDPKRRPQHQHCPKRQLPISRVTVPNRTVPDGTDRFQPVDTKFAVTSNRHHRDHKRLVEGERPHRVEGRTNTLIGNADNAPKRLRADASAQIRTKRTQRQTTISSIAIQPATLSAGASRPSLKN